MKTRFIDEHLPRARAMRKEGTTAERLLWHLLRRGQLNGLHFRRQEPIGEFIVDFCCIEKLVVVELDGEYHDEEEQIIKDADRTEKLNEWGFIILRYENDYFLERPDRVLKDIKQVCIERPSQSTFLFSREKKNKFKKGISPDEI